ncbi:MAG: hypothetical protein Q9168_001731 [Polycauliona sp. 1 TL-2023]
MDPIPGSVSHFIAQVYEWCYKSRVRSTLLHFDLKETALDGRDVTNVAQELLTFATIVEAARKRNFVGIVRVMHWIGEEGRTRRHHWGRTGADQLSENIRDAITPHLDYLTRHQSCTTFICIRLEKAINNYTKGSGPFTARELGVDDQLLDGIVRGDLALWFKEETERIRQVCLNGIYQDYENMWWQLYDIFRTLFTLNDPRLEPSITAHIEASDRADDRFALSAILAAANSLNVSASLYNFFGLEQPWKRPALYNSACKAELQQRYTDGDLAHFLEGWQRASGLGEKAWLWDGGINWNRPVNNIVDNFMVWIREEGLDKKGASPNVE